MHYILVFKAPHANYIITAKHLMVFTSKLHAKSLIKMGYQVLALLKVRP